MPGGRVYSGRIDRTLAALAPHLLQGKHLGRLGRQLGRLEDILGNRVGEHARDGDGGADCTLRCHWRAEAGDAEQDEDDPLDLDNTYGCGCSL